MPTGYTCGVADGTVTNFRDFALTCARNFGACIMLRDEPLTPDIPEFEPSDYNAERLGEARKALADLDAMTPEQCKVAAMADYQEQLDYHNEQLTRKREQRARYVRMLADAKAFVAPTPDHQGLKEFMVSQLVESINWDCNESHCNPPERKSWEEWRRERSERLMRDIDYHTKGDREERERTAQRNAWVSALKQALSV